MSQNERVRFCPTPAGTNHWGALLPGIAAVIGLTGCGGSTPKADCMAGSTQCGGTCVNLQEDQLNCGACGLACDLGQVCSAGQCLTSCPSGLAVCGETCRDLQNDASNCNACGVSCPATWACFAGACTPVWWQVLTAPPGAGCPGLPDFTPGGQNFVYDIDGGSSQVYSVSDDTWSALDASLAPDCYAMPAWFGGSMYQIDGSSVYAYTISANSWATLINGTLPFATYAAQATADDSGHVYVLADLPNHKILQVNIADNTVATFDGAADIPAATGGEPRAAWDNLTQRLYFGDFTVTELYSFDPATDNVVRLADFPGTSGLSTAFCGDRHGHIFTTDAGTDANMWEYTIAADTWSSIGYLPYVHGISESCTVTGDGWLYFASGSGHFVRLRVF